MIRNLALFPVVIGLLTACGGGGGGGGNNEPPDPDPTTVSFSLDIQPLFQTECITCHGSAGGLDVQTYSALLAGGNSGAVVIAGDPDNSFLVQHLEGTRTPQMPLSRPPLSQPQIDTIRTWIAEGALDN